MHHVLNSLLDLAEGHRLVAVVQHGHHGVHAPEHLGQNLVLVGQGEARWDSLGEGVIPLVGRQLGAERLGTPLRFCRRLRLSLLGSSLSLRRELFGSSQRGAERLGVACRYRFGRFAAASCSGFGWGRGCWRRQGGGGERSIAGVLAALLNPLETRLEGCDVFCTQTLNE